MRLRTKVPHARVKGLVCCWDEGLVMVEEGFRKTLLPFTLHRVQPPYRPLSTCLPMRLIRCRKPHATLPPPQHEQTRASNDSKGRSSTGRTAALLWRDEGVVATREEEAVLITHKVCVQSEDKVVCMCCLCECSLGAGHAGPRLTPTARLERGGSIVYARA